MLKTKQVFLLTPLLTLLHCVKCHQLDIEITHLQSKMGLCSEYFQYQRIDEFINGKLKLPNIEMGDTVKLTFHKRDLPNLKNFNGILLPDESSKTVMNRLQNGQIITYRVDFPLALDLPILSKIFVNSKELCNTKQNDLMSSEILLILKHTMQIINGSLPVFTHNINIPDFVENSICGLIDEEIAGSGIKPLTYSRSEVVRGEYPWLAAIYKKQSTGITFLCGGSIVTSRIILTAAHCFPESTDQIVAVLGRHNLTNYLEDSYAIYEIAALILHPEYKYGIGFSDADLAILKIKERVSFTQFIKPICLWFGSADESLVINKTTVVAGWGSDDNAYAISAVPKKVRIDIVSRNTCLPTSSAYTEVASSRTLCAENRDGSGLCEGDSGGGLLINRFGRWMLRGVVSEGSTDQNRCHIKVFSDVAKHLTWLEKYVAKKEIISGSIEDICGVSGTNLRSEHPWLVAVYLKLNTGIHYNHAGTLISSRTVLTSAKFIASAGVEFSPDIYRVYLGRYDLNDIQENEVVMRDVENIIFHPDYIKWAPLFYFQENAIALLQMKSPVDFTEYVKPICLWNKPKDKEAYIVEQSVTLIGWDRKDVFESSSTVPTLMKVERTSVQECGYAGDMSTRIWCVPRLENENRSIMMIKRNERWFLIGINSVKENYIFYKSEGYFVYQDLEKYLTWINKNMLS